MLCAAFERREPR